MFSPASPMKRVWPGTTWLTEARHVEIHAKLRSVPAAHRLRPYARGIRGVSLFFKSSASAPPGASSSCRRRWPRPICRSPPSKVSTAPASTPWPAISSAARPLAPPASSAAMPASGWPLTPIPSLSPASLISIASTCSPLPDRACSSASSRISRIVRPAAPSCSPLRKPRCARWPVRDSFFPTSPSASPPFASPFRRCAAPRRHRPARPVPARPHLRPLPAASRRPRSRRARPPAPAHLARQRPRAPQRP
jgi:hypothetical protein